jgi:rod shape determining protein RodA
MQKFLFAIRRADKVLLIVTLLLFLLGATIHYSLGLSVQEEGVSVFAKQLFFFFISLGAFGFFLSVDYRIWQPFYPLLFLLSLGALLLVFTPLGETIRGVRSWLDFGFFVWQPVEVVKLFMIISLAGYFTKQGRHLRTWKPLIVSGVAAAILVFLTLAQPDLGSAMILFFLWLGLVLVLGISKWQISLMVLGFIGIAIFGWFFLLADYQKGRLTTFLDPASDPLGSGYNLTQSIIAIGSGGVLGQGIGFGSQSQLKFLPESRSDFIFAVVGEELGFAGISLLLALFTIFAWRMILIAKASSSDFGQLIVIGVLVVIVVQAIMNMSINMGMLPVTGFSLPFISAGGSYLISVMAMVGIAQSVKIHS